MADQASNQSPSAPAPQATDNSAISQAPIPPDAPAPVPSAVKPLSKEEQMAAFEEDLKYNDWGHQPC